MNNDNILIVISTLTLVTLISIWAGLRYKKIEVDNVLENVKADQSGEKTGFTGNHDFTTQSPNSINYSPKPEIGQPIENLPVDGEVLIDYNLLQNYSDYLGYWISQFNFVIDYVSIPLLASVVGYTCVIKLSPVDLALYKPYAFVSSLIALPINAKINGKLDYLLSQNIEDKKNIKELTNLFLESSKESGRQNREEGYFLTFLETQLVFAMSDTSREGRIAQYRWIKEYVKDHQISEK